MRKSVNWDRVLLLGLCVVFGVWMAAARRHADLPPGPSPISKTGEHVLLLVDNTAPSIPQGIVLNSPLFRALLLSGHCSVVEIHEDLMREKNYAPLLTEAGGAPALIVLDHDANKVVAGRFPTDVKAAEKLVNDTLANPPAPLAAWPPPQVVNRGGELPTQNDTTGTFVDVGGQRRYLLSLVDPARLKAVPSYAAHNPVFPETELYDIDRRNMFGAADWILDQGQTGECAACSTVGAVRRGRVLHGMGDVPLSPGFLYSLVNGGKDKGAYITDAFLAMQKVGTCTYQTLAIKPFLTRQIPPSLMAQAKLEAPRFQIRDYYRCDTWKELCSAMATGRFLPVFGVQVGTPSGQPGNFGHFDRYGVAGHDKGPGNHALTADGMRKLPDGRRVLDVPNSWGQWGPFNNGRVYLDEQHLFNGSDQPSVCVIRLPGRDPQDPFSPPAYKGK